jgi:SAM-dependent methyltransferase
MFMRSSFRRLRPLAWVWRVLALRAQRRYWRTLKEEEGTLANDHFEHVFTTHFGLLPSFYDGKRILDIGCGPRGSLEWATKAAERVGLDPLIDTYRQLGIDQHAMRYVAGYAEHMPFAAESFDVVSSFNSLDHVDRLDRVIAEIKRVLKPGGLFLLLTDVNHRPRLREPHDYSWDIVRRFEPELRVLEERHFEDRGGVHASSWESVPYDHGRGEERHGVLSAKFEKRR